MNNTLQHVINPTELAVFIKARFPYLAIKAVAVNQIYITNTAKSVQILAFSISALSPEIL